MKDLRDHRDYIVSVKDVEDGIIEQYTLSVIDESAFLEDLEKFLREVS